MSGAKIYFNLPLDRRSLHNSTATVIITGKGNYSGTVTVAFTIKEADESGTDVEGGGESGSGTEAEAETEMQDKGTSAGTEKESETGNGSEEEETETEIEIASQAEAVKTGDITPVTSMTLIFLAAGDCFMLLALQRREHDHKM